MAKFKFNFGSDTSTTLFHNANASGNDFNMYTTCHTSGEPVFGNIRVSGTSNFSNIVSDGTVCFAQNVCLTGGNRAVVVPSGYGALQSGSKESLRFCTNGVIQFNNSEDSGIAPFKMWVGGTTNACNHLRLGTDIGHYGDAALEIYQYSTANDGTLGGHVTVNGRLGVGTTSPSGILHTKSDDLGVVLQTSASSNKRMQIFFQDSGGTQTGRFGNDISGGDTAQMQWAAGSGSTPQMTLTSDGNVGIGTTSPSVKLHVSGVTCSTTSVDTPLLNASGQTPIKITGDANAAFICFTGGASDDWQVGTVNSLAGFGFKNTTDDEYRFFIGDGGCVGIGTTSPARHLHVKGANTVPGEMIIQGGKDTVAAAGEMNARLAFASNDGSVSTGTTSNIAGAIDSITELSNGAWVGMAFSTYKQPSGSEDGLVEHMRIRHDGNVGIGTNAPYHKLDVNGSIRSKTRAIADSSTPGVTLSYDTSDNTGKIETWTTKPFEIETAGVSRLFICSSGNVGIGTTTPVTKLDVFSGSGTKPNDPFEGQNQLFLSSGSTANAGLTIAADDGTNDIVSFFQSNQSADVGLIGTQSNHALRIRTNNSDRITILGAGNVGIGCTSPAYKLDVCGSNDLVRFRSTSDSASDSVLRMENNSGTALFNMRGSGLLCLSGPVCIPSAGCLKLGRSDNGRHTCLFTDNSGTQLKNDGGDPIFICSAAYIDFWSCGCSSRAMRINGNNVGIGTHEPDKPLEIRRDSLADNSSNTLLKLTGQFAVSGIYCEERVGIGFEVINSGGGLQTYDNAITFGYNSTLALMQSGGNVGIGTTTPQRQLHVHCSSSSWDQCASLRLSSENVTNFYGEIQFHRGTDSTDDMGLNLLVSNSGSENLTPKLHVNVDGNVGIGTTEPGSKLSIVGTGARTCITDGTNVVQMGLWDGATNRIESFGGRPLFITSYSGGIRWGLSGSVHMCMDTSGNLGIGSSFDPTAKLMVSAGGTKAKTGSVFHAIAGNSYSDTLSGGANFVFENPSTSQNAGDGVVLIKTATTAGTAFAVCNGTANIFNICNSGNVGIGTTSPDYPLEVKSSANSNTYLSTENTTNANAGVRMKNCEGEWILIANDRLRIYDVDNSSERMSILSNGNVGIGTTSPDTLLKVYQAGTSGNSYFEGSVQIGGANASYGAILGYSALNSGRVNISNLNNAGGADSTIKLGFGAITSGAPANTVVEVNQSGNMLVTGDITAYSSSDCRLKNNLKIISCPTDKVKALSGYEFDWNTRDQDIHKGNDVGVIAQEVEKVLPQIVCTRDTGYKAIKYEKIVPLLIEATKEQQCTIEKQQRQIDTLTCQVELLLKRCA